MLRLPAHLPVTRTEIGQRRPPAVGDTICCLLDCTPLLPKTAPKWPRDAKTSSKEQDGWYHKSAATARANG